MLGEEWEWKTTASGRRMVCKQHLGYYIDFFESLEVQFGSITADSTTFDTQ